MVFDSIAYFNRYIGLHPLFRIVGKHLEDENLGKISNGTYQLGQGISVIVSTYTGKSIHEGKIEYHRKNIDVQVVMSGSERMGICPIETSMHDSFDIQNDFGLITGVCDYIKLQANYFCILFPEDGHMPGISLIDGDACEIKKVVFKVPVHTD
jgi:YhcH/YjgK/YiaL family protein